MILDVSTWIQDPFFKEILHFGFYGYINDTHVVASVSVCGVIMCVFTCLVLRRKLGYLEVIFIVTYDACGWQTKGLLAFG